MYKDYKCYIIERYMTATILQLNTNNLCDQTNELIIKLLMKAVIYSRTRLTV